MYRNKYDHCLQWYVSRRLQSNTRKGRERVKINMYPHIARVQESKKLQIKIVSQTKNLVTTVKSLPKKQRSFKSVS